MGTVGPNSGSLPGLDNMQDTGKKPLIPGLGLLSNFTKGMQGLMGSITPSHGLLPDLVSTGPLSGKVAGSILGGGGKGR